MITATQTSAQQADLILGRAATAVAAVNDPRDRLAQHVGILSGEIRRLCGELEKFQPQLEAHEIAVPVMLGTTEAQAIFDSEDGEMLAVLVNGADVLGALSYSAIDDCQAAFEDWQDEQRAMAEDERAAWRDAA